MNASTQSSFALQTRLLMQAVKRNQAEKIDRTEFGQSITGRILRFISDGPKHSALIAGEVGIATTQVSASLAIHVKTGRVIAIEGKSGRREWALNPDFDKALHDEIQEAVRLLRKHGYTVQKGARA